MRKFGKRFLAGLALGMAFCAPLWAPFLLAVQPNVVYPRMITPNGDGINDEVFFVFENRTAAQVLGTIYDIRSAKVVDIRENNDFSVADGSVLTWDGRDGQGAVVSSGIYIYKIQVGSKVYTGTVGVAR